MLANIGLPGIALIVILVVFLFGSKKLPELTEAVSKSMKKFKDAQKEVEEETKNLSESEVKKEEDKGNG
jgi:sec-independent protein translocase protein TatA